MCLVSVLPALYDIAEFRPVEPEMFRNLMWGIVRVVLSAQWPETRVKPQVQAGTCLRGVLNVLVR
jgi:hypothetical protein